MSCDSRYICQNITKIIAEFPNNFQKVLMLKIIILDLAIRLQSKCSGFIYALNHFFSYKKILNEQALQGIYLLKTSIVLSGPGYSQPYRCL